MITCASASAATRSSGHDSRAYALGFIKDRAFMKIADTASTAREPKNQAAISRYRGAPVPSPLIETPYHGYLPWPDAAEPCATGTGKSTRICAEMRAPVEAVAGGGLGLAISQRILELHQGMIEASSQLNEGTTFTFRLAGASATV